MSKLKIEDRVAVYDSQLDYGAKGIVVELLPNAVRVDLEDYTHRPLFHPSQCRRLVKKPRREWWIAFSKDTGTFWNINTSNPYIDATFDVVHVREVRRRK